jgi:hypothetical protein
MAVLVEHAIHAGCERAAVAKLAAIFAPRTGKLHLGRAAA